MLTLEETRWSLGAFKAWSILNLLPIEVDVKSGKIQRQSNKVKVFIWKFFYGVGLAHWLYVFGRLVQSTVIEPQKYFRWDHFVLHFDITPLYAVAYFTGYRLFVKNREENVMIFNQLFEEREDPVQKMIDESTQLGMQSESESGRQGNKTGAKSENQNEVTENPPKSKSEVGPPPRPLLTWPPQYSLDELMAKLLPLVLVSTVCASLLIFAMDPSHLNLLYSSLPPEWQNVWSFLILLTVEALCLALVLFTCAFSLTTQVLFFGKCQLEFKKKSLQLRGLQEKFQNCSLGNENGGRSIEKEIWILHQILGEMRELVLLIELFNRCFPFCIFAWKIYSLAVSIVLYFFVIRHFEDFPLFAAFIGYSAICITVIYTIAYEHAFSIPGKMDELKNEFLLTAQKTTSKSNANFNESKNLKAEMKREIKRIHGVGIKVGSFHQMERESTPNFIDFVVNQVVSLLVTFPR